ncbi:MAG TPA: RES family NAD+ phosphorylase [Thermoanaerobaculia bacterium]|nr:RES family NAD+ phosphorylase [Thermoanaerobaculia bacterium]
MARAGKAAPGDENLPAAPRLVWRIVAARHAERVWSGEGARRWGGRWNPPGVAVVYASSTLSLAALELLVHLDPDLLPINLVAVAAELPSDPPLPTLRLRRLPAGWRTYPAPEFLQELGAEWVRTAGSLALAVPSAVIPSEWNVLLNPAHPDFSRLRMHPAEPFAFDSRPLRETGPFRTKRKQRAGK